MGMRDLINKFTSGELDPKFFAEVDYDGYRKSAAKLRNVIATPQGGVQRRFGTFYQTTILDGATYVTNIDNVRLIEYEFSNTEIFDIIIRQSTTNVVAFDIYLGSILNGVPIVTLQITLNAPAATYTQAMIREIRWVKDYDRIILLHADVPPYQLRRIANNNWVIERLQFQFFPTYDFSATDNPATLPTPNVPYTSNTVTFTPNLVHATTLTANTAVYTSNHVNGLYNGNAGLFRITSVNAAGTVATGYCLEDFFDTSPINGTLSNLTERAWNNGQVIAGAPAGINRGWPAHGRFYQSRLLLGGSPALPGTVYASNTKEYSNFDDSVSDPSFTYSLEISVTGNDVLTDILATKSIVLLSNKGSATSNLLLAEPTTPTNNFINTQGTEGSREMNAVYVDNQILYADTAGNTIWDMAYDIPDTGYTISNASILSAQLIRSPRWADVFDPDDLDGRYYLLVNGDGTMAVYNSLKDENIKAWTQANTTGAYIDVACTANQAKTLTRRKVGTLTPTGYPEAVYIVDSTFNAFRNITAQTLTNTPVPYFVNDGDYLLFGSEIVFTKLGFVITIDASQPLNLTYEFLDATNNWETFVPVFDGTVGLTSDGIIMWNQPQVDDWLSQPVLGTTPSYNELKSYYWLRIKRNIPGPITNPVSNITTINTQNRIYLEDCDFSIYMDCQIQTTSDVNGDIIGLDPLAGQNAFIFANEFPLKTYYISPTGTVNVGIDNANANITIGLDYTTMIVPMPVIALMQNGWSVYEPVHVKTMYIDYYNSLGIVVQGQNVPQISPGSFMTQPVPVPETGYYKMAMYNGWDSRAEFLITQSYPAPMLIRGVSYTIEVSP